MAAQIKDIINDLLRSTQREGIEDLINYLETSDFFTAPASTKYHGCYEGGLAEHCLNVYNCLYFQYENLKDSDYNLPAIGNDSIILAALLHDLCKVNTYMIEWKNQKVYKENGSKSDAAGKFDWETVPGYTRKPLLSMGHSAKSIYIAQQFIKLTTEEAQAILWHMGAYDTSPYMTLNELGEAYSTNLLAFLLNAADMMATYISENENYS